MYKHKPRYVDITSGMDDSVFIFLKNDRFVMKTTTKKGKRNDLF